jgi:Ca2+:H+ antiporter
VGAVIAAVHHAEVVAHRVGEPLGTLVLAVAVTVIEASLILSMMLVGARDAARLPRDTIYAALMLILNGVVGVLPTFTITTPSGTYSDSQLTFAALASITLWAVFVFVQTVRHRDYFLPESDPENPESHADLPSNVQMWASSGLLLVSLAGVVGLAKVLSPAIERAVVAVRAPKNHDRHRDRHAGADARDLGGPACCARQPAADEHEPRRRLRARQHRSHHSRGRDGLGGAWIPLVLGLEPKDLVMLALTFVVSAVTLGTGRTHLMQGAVHLVIFAAFLFLALVP